MSASDELLPGSVTVPFAQIDATLARLAGAKHGRRGPGRALTATVVAVGDRARLVEPARALSELAQPGAIRAILISTGSSSEPAARVAPHTVAIDDLRPEFVNNAVAALRLSSLPLLVWWRGGPIETLGDLADLADRLVLDSADPGAGWSAAPTFFERAAVTDLRWTRLTRWRALMAHFFDIPEVRAARFTQLVLTGSDAPALRLFSGWMSVSLKWDDQMKVDIRDGGPGSPPVAAIELRDGQQHLSLKLAASGTCIESAARAGAHSASQTVSLGDQRLAALIAEELRVRSRDLAFEQALRAAGGFRS